MKPSEILRAARDHLIEVGLNKDGYFFKDGYRADSAPVCILGAMHWVHDSYALMGDSRNYRNAHSLVFMTAMEKAEIDGVADLVHWNDKIATQDDVIRLYDEAISRAEKAESEHSYRDTPCVPHTVRVD